MLSLSCRLWRMLCHFDRREDQLLMDPRQQNSLCESRCRQRGDRGNVSSFISLILTKSLVVPPPHTHTHTKNSFPYPSPSLSYYLQPPLPSTHLHPPFQLQRMRGIRSILSLCLSASPQTPATSHIFCALFHPVIAKPFSAWHQGSTCQLLCLQ